MCSLNVSFPQQRGRELPWRERLLCCLDFGRKKKKRGEGKKIWSNKTVSQNFQSFTASQVKTMSQILCDINTQSCWLQGEVFCFFYLPAGESVVVIAALPRPCTAAGLVRLHALGVQLHALWDFVISKWGENSFLISGTGLAQSG